MVEVTSDVNLEFVENGLINIEQAVNSGDIVTIASTTVTSIEAVLSINNDTQLSNFVIREEKSLCQVLIDEHRGISYKVFCDRQKIHKKKDNFCKAVFLL